MVPDELKLAAFGTTSPDGEQQDGGGAAAAVEEVRVVGKASCWDVGGDAHKELKSGSFSMVRMEVDRSELRATIKPLSRDVDPEELRRQARWDRIKEQSEEDDLRRVIDEVRRLKREGVEDWQEQMQPKKGVDYWEADDPDLPQEYRGSDSAQ